MNRNTLIKSAGLLSLSAIQYKAFAHSSDKPHSDQPIVEFDGILGQGDHKYRLVQNWAKPNGKHINIHNCHAMVQTKDGNLQALCDGIEHNFITFNPNGECVGQWGTEYPGAHGLELFEENGEEHYIVVDGGWAIRSVENRPKKEQGKVVKIKKDGSLVFAFGHPLTIGEYTPEMRFQPCDAAVGPNGDIYISDGYGSQFILQYNKYGQFKRKFGGRGKLDSHLSGAHGISIDTRDKNFPKIIASSRSQNILKFFDLDGKYLYKVEVPGAYLGQAVVQGDYLYSGVCWSKDKKTGKRNSNSGFVTILDGDNKVVSNLGGSAPIYKNGKLQPIYQTEKVFNHVHDVCVDKQGNIYALQWNAKGALPFKLEKVHS